MRADHESASERIVVHHLEEDPAWREQVRHVVSSMGGYSLGGLEVARIVVLELWYNGDDAFAQVQKLKREPHAPRFIALTHRYDAVALHRSMLGALDGFVWKTQNTAAQLRESLLAIAQGRSYFRTELRAVHQRLSAAPDAYFKILTSTEEALMPLFGRGLFDAEIARSTGGCSDTIRWHRGEIMRRLGLHTSAELIVWATTNGFVPPILPEPLCKREARIPSAKSRHLPEVDNPHTARYAIP